MYQGRQLQLLLLGISQKLHHLCMCDVIYACATLFTTSSKSHDTNDAIFGKNTQNFPQLSSLLMTKVIAEFWNAA